MSTYLSVAIHAWHTFDPKIGVYQDANDCNTSFFDRMLMNYPDDQTYDELFKINQDKVWVLLYFICMSTVGDSRTEEVEEVEFEKVGANFISGVVVDQSGISNG